MGAAFVVGVFGVLILAHATYSTIHYRELLKIMEEEFSGPPINVLFELLLGFVLCLWAALAVPGKFLSILPHSEENRFELLCRLNWIQNMKFVLSVNQMYYKRNSANQMY
ncbi:hypothetical protein CsatA_000902 [Cannabis sativa]